METVNERSMSRNVNVMRCTKCVTNDQMSHDTFISDWYAEERGHEIEHTENINS